MRCRRCGGVMITMYWWELLIISFCLYGSFCLGIHAIALDSFEERMKLYKILNRSWVIPLALLGVAWGVWKNSSANIKVDRDNLKFYCDFGWKILPNQSNKILK